MAEALEEETADGDHVGAEEGDEVEGDYDVEGDGAAEFYADFRVSVASARQGVEWSSCSRNRSRDSI